MVREVDMPPLLGRVLEFKGLVFDEEPTEGLHRDPLGIVPHLGDHLRSPRLKHETGGEVREWEGREEVTVGGRDQREGFMRE